MSARIHGRPVTGGTSVTAVDGDHTRRETGVRRGTCAATSAAFSDISPRCVPPRGGVLRKTGPAGRVTLTRWPRGALGTAGHVTLRAAGGRAASHGRAHRRATAGSSGQMAARLRYAWCWQMYVWRASAPSPRLLSS